MGVEETTLPFGPRSLTLRHVEQESPKVCRGNLIRHSRNLDADPVVRVDVEHDAVGYPFRLEERCTSKAKAQSVGESVDVLLYSSLLISATKPTSASGSPGSSTTCAPCGAGGRISGSPTKPSRSAASA